MTISDLHGTEITQATRTATAYDINPEHERNNMIANGNFAQALDIANQPPDGWEMASGSWDSGELFHSLTVQDTANRALHWVSGRSLTNKIIGTLAGNLIPIAQEQLYRLAVVYREASGGTGVNLTYALALYDKDKAFISNFTKTAAVTGPAGSWIYRNQSWFWGADLASTCRYVLPYLQLASSGDDHYIDNFILQVDKPRFRAYRSTDQTITNASAGTWQQIGFANESFDISGVTISSVSYGYDTSNFEFTALRSSPYTFESALRVDLAGTACDWELGIFVNGSLAAILDYKQVPSAGTRTLSGSAKFNLSKGDTVDIRVRRTANGTDETILGGSTLSFFSGQEDRQL